MYDAYYENQINELERDRKIAALGMNAAIAFIKFKNDREKSKVRDRVRSLTTSNLDQVSTVRKRLKKDLDKIKDNTHVSNFDVEDYLENNESRYQIELDYGERSNIARVISRNPVAALNQYSMDYISAKRRIDQVRKDQERDKQEKEKEKTRREYEEPTYEPIRQRPVKEVPFSGISDEESRRLIQEQIDKEIASKYEFFGFSYDEQKRIRELYPELNHYSDFYSVETIEKAININKITNKEQIKAEEMMNLGLLTIDVVTNDLFQNNRFTSIDIFNKLGVSNSLNKYKSAYNKYRRYYKSLSPEQRQQIETQISNNKNYSELFGNSIASPELITSRINLRVSNYITDNYTQFYNYNQKDFYSKSIHATKYMSIQEIVNLYKRIEYKEQDRRIYATNDEDRITMEKAKRDYLAQLQSDFARIILSRLETHNKQVDYNKMTPEEQERYLKEENIKLAAIINDLFKEQALSPSLQKIGVVEGKGENLVDTYEAKEQAKTQVFGLSKIKKAFAKVTGKWSKYLMLMDKDELSKSEQEEIKGMFR